MSHEIWSPEQVRAYFEAQLPKQAEPLETA